MRLACVVLASMTAIGCIACSVMTPTAGRPIEPSTYESLTPGESQLEVRRAIGREPDTARYTDTGRIEGYGTFHYSAKNYIPGYAFVGKRGDCQAWWFEYDAQNMLVKKWTDHDCKRLLGRDFRGLGG